jgi:hypothetical protein
MLKEDQTRLFQNHQSAFTNAVSICSENMAEVQDTVRNVIESLQQVYGGLEEVSKQVTSFERRL